MRVMERLRWFRPYQTAWYISQNIIHKKTDDNSGLWIQPPRAAMFRAAPFILQQVTWLTTKAIEQSKKHILGSLRWEKNSEWSDFTEENIQLWFIMWQCIYLLLQRRPNFDISLVTYVLLMFLRFVQTPHNHST